MQHLTSEMTTYAGCLHCPSAILPQYFDPYLTKYQLHNIILIRRRGVAVCFRRKRQQQRDSEGGRMKVRLLATLAVALIALGAIAPVLASNTPGQLGYEGQPGNQGNGLQGYEGQPGNQ